jgi:hypothetical protein
MQNHSGSAVEGSGGLRKTRTGARLQIKLTEKATKGSAATRCPNIYLEVIKENSRKILAKIKTPFSRYEVIPLGE